MRFGESVGVRVFETSAKENINVEEVSVIDDRHACIGPDENAFSQSLLASV